MATTPATLYEVRKGAAWITLNRAENRNALSTVLVTELFDHLTEANGDDQVRCIVITGNGPAVWVRRAPRLSIEDGFKETAAWSARMFRSEEGAEGMAAFREKRKPSWVTNLSNGETK